jgi:hypothetical protein
MSVPTKGYAQRSVSLGKAAEDRTVTCTPFVTVLSGAAFVPLFATQMLAPSKAAPSGNPLTENCVVWFAPYQCKVATYNGS